MPRKSKKKSAPKSSGGGGGIIASKRHWIYTTTPTGSGEGDEYSQYLHKRVQRTLVRSIPSTYSYFGSDDRKIGGEFYCVIILQRDITCYVLRGEPAVMNAVIYL